MPIAQQIFSQIFCKFCVPTALPTKVGPLNPSTVTFASNSIYVTQPSNVQPFSSGGTTFHVGNPNAVDTPIYLKLMAPYTR